MHVLNKCKFGDGIHGLSLKRMLPITSFSPKSQLFFVHPVFMSNNYPYQSLVPIMKVPVSIDAVSHEFVEAGGGWI